MRYEIPMAEAELIIQGVPELKELGTISKDLKIFIIPSNNLIRLNNLKYSINRITMSSFGEDYDAWVVGKTVHPFKIYKFLKDEKVHKSLANPRKYQAPLDLDFKTQLSKKLHKKLGPKVQGIPTYTEYFETKRPIQDGEGGSYTLDEFGNVVFEYINKIARVDFDFTFDAYGFILIKKADLRWYRENDVLSVESKDIGQVYDPTLDHEKRIEEGKVRRESIVNGLQSPVLNMLRQIYSEKSILEILTIGRTFMNKKDEIFRDFIDKSLSVDDPDHVDFGKKVAWVTIRDYSDLVDDEWLDADLGAGITARQFILGELDI